MNDRNVTESDGLRMPLRVQKRIDKQEYTLPRFRPGDYLKIALFAGLPAASVWIRVSHCDEQHGLVFGTIDSDPSQELGKAFSRGRTLAASYSHVIAHQLSA